MKPILRVLFLVALPIFIWSCSGETQNSGVQDFPNTLQASAQNALLDIPTSLAYGAPSVDETSVSLSKLTKQMASLQSDRESAYAAYLAVPIFVNLAEEAKYEVKKFVQEFAKVDLPPKWEGQVDSLFAKTLYADSIVDGKSLKFYSLRAFKDGDLRLSLRFLRDSLDRYRGVFYMANPADYNAKVRVEFDQITTDSSQSMVVSFIRNKEGLETQNDPSFVRIKTKQKALGRMVVSGLSYHPLFEDDFWGQGPYVYAFRAISAPKENRSILKVAFAKSEGELKADEDFLTKNALDVAILERTTLRFRQLMRDSSDMNKLVYYCLDSAVSADEALQGAHLISLISYVPTRTPEELTTDDFMQFLEYNKVGIFAGTSKLSELRAMYLLVHIQQPLFLSNQARVIGAGKLSIPDLFPIAISELDNENFPAESAEDLATIEVVE